jgi:hypothetical protein
LALVEKMSNIGVAGNDDSLRIGQLSEKGKHIDWVYIGYGVRNAECGMRKE